MIRLVVTLIIAACSLLVSPKIHSQDDAFDAKLKRMEESFLASKN